MACIVSAQWLTSTLRLWCRRGRECPEFRSGCCSNWLPAPLRMVMKGVPAHSHMLSFQLVQIHSASPGTCKTSWQLQASSPWVVSSALDPLYKACITPRLRLPVATHFYLVLKAPCVLSSWHGCGECEGFSRLAKS